MTVDFARRPDVLAKRKVRTAAGVKHFHAPIGTPIVRGTDGKLHAKLPKTKDRGKSPGQIGGDALRGPKTGIGGESKRPLKTLTPASIEDIQHQPGKAVKVKDGHAAVAELLKGNKVELPTNLDVSILLDDLRALVADAKKKGDKAPTINLCNVTVKRSSLFCVESKGVPRIKMPQLSGVPTPGSKASKLAADDRGEVSLTEQFRAHLKAKGVSIEDTDLPATSMKASQNELNGGKVAGITGAIEEGKMKEARLFVSKDNYVVDGHHRWAATIGADLRDGVDDKTTIPVARIDMSILDILAESNSFAADWGIPQASVGAPVPTKKTFRRLDLLEKQRRVRTPAGAKRYKRPIGSLITYADLKPGDLIRTSRLAGGTAVVVEKPKWETIDGERWGHAKLMTETGQPYGSFVGAHEEVTRIRSGVEKRSGAKHNKAWYLTHPNPKSTPKEILGHHGHKPHGPSILWPALYEHLRRKGKTKEAAAKISNSAWHKKRMGMATNTPTSARGIASAAARSAASGRLRKQDETFTSSIIRKDDDKHTVFGWAYVTHDTLGDLNVDGSGEFIDDVDELEDMAYGFVLKSRTGDADHTNVVKSTLVESVVFTPEKIEAMGLKKGDVPIGWWTGWKIHDDEVWDGVKKGRYSAFSIYGKSLKASLDEGS